MPRWRRRRRIVIFAGDENLPMDFVFLRRRGVEYNGSGEARAVPAISWTTVMRGDSCCSKAFIAGSGAAGGAEID